LDGHHICVRVKHERILNERGRRATRNLRLNPASNNDRDADKPIQLDANHPGQTLFSPLPKSTPSFCFLVFSVTALHPSLHFLAACFAANASAPSSGTPRIPCTTKARCDRGKVALVRGASTRSRFPRRQQSFEKPEEIVTYSAGLLSQVQ
jgi:hypothetical protein